MRQVVGYGDLAEGGDAGVAGPSKVNGKQPHWTEDGKPISASAARRYRRVLQLLATGEIDDAEQLLTKMETAVRNVEVVEALAWAKRKAGAAGQGDSGKDEEDKDDLDSSSSEVEGTQDDRDENGIVEGIHFSIPDPIVTRPSQGGDYSHAEIWDDSALIDAWDAALEEYNYYDAQRTASRQKRGAEEAHEDSSTKRTKVESTNGQSTRTTFVPKKHSILWHVPPPITTTSMNETPPEAADQELAKRKVKAHQLLNQMDHSVDGHVNATSEAMKKVEPVTSRRTIKGVRPPSSHIPGNPAWHSACAIVTQTPNAIGEQQPGPSMSSTTTMPVTNTTPQEEVLQNLAMAWYYAGYYQAMALSQASQR